MILLICTLPLVILACLSTVVQADYFALLHDEFGQSVGRTTRTYYIAIDEVVWDYHPSQQDAIYDVPLNESPAKLWVAQSAATIGSRYYKALYREYTDNTYTTLVERPDWQGNMGPILRAEVGDSIEIHLWNRASYNFSMHPHGVFYHFHMEGAVYKGAPKNTALRPNDTYTYVWQVLPRAGPGPQDGHSIVWGYHSHVAENDIYAGLYGAILVYRPGTLNDEMIQNEYVMTLFDVDENASPYLQRTVSTLAPLLRTDSATETTTYTLSNIKPSINGMIHGHPGDLVLAANSTTRWYLLGWGSINDIQDVRWDDAEVSLYGQRVSNIRLLPATFRTVDVTVPSPGKHLFGFLNGESGIHGMTLYYNVQ